MTYIRDGYDDTTLAIFDNYAVCVEEEFGSDFGANWYMMDINVDKPYQNKPCFRVDALRKNTANDYTHFFYVIVNGKAHCIR